MDQIVVPQFLTVEDKIVGPIKVRQFIEMMIAGLMMFVFYRIFDFALFLVLSVIVGSITGVLAFVPINGQPFHFFLLNFFDTLKSPKLKVWRKKVTRSDIISSTAKPNKKAIIQPAIRQSISLSRLSELALVVDTGGVYQGENNGLENNKL